MNITAILIAAAVIAVAGIIVGIGLGLFGEKFKVEVDEKEVAIREDFLETTAAAAVSQAVTRWQRQLQRAKLLQCMSCRWSTCRRKDRCYPWRICRSSREEGCICTL